MACRLMPAPNRVLGRRLEEAPEGLRVEVRGGGEWGSVRQWQAGDVPALESWLWEAACAIRSGEPAAKSLKDEP